MSRKLDEVFDVDNPKMEVITSAGQVITPHEPDRVDKNVEYDYEKTRSNLHSLLSQGQEALYHALEIAKQSEHPRAFEVVGNLMRQLSDINHQLLDLSDKRQKLSGKKESDKDQPTNVTNNAIFVGSTAELGKIIKQIK